MHQKRFRWVISLAFVAFALLAIFFQRYAFLDTHPDVDLAIVGRVVSIGRGQHCGLDSVSSLVVYDDLRVVKGDYLSTDIGVIVHCLESFTLRAGDSFSVGDYHHLVLSAQQTRAHDLLLERDMTDPAAARSPVYTGNRYYALTVRMAATR